MSLEDFCEDIIDKAQKGLKISDAELCNKANIGEKSLEKVKTGDFDEITIRKVAPVLGLDPEALIASGKKTWMPKTIQIPGLKRYITHYWSMGVNAYLIWDPKTHLAVIFDTGADATEIIQDIDKLGLTPKMLLLTHSHTDHIDDVKRIHKTFPNLKIAIHKKELIAHAEPITEGIEFRVGHLQIETRKTSGHSIGGLSYLVNGLEKLVIVVGDALFAGSMGSAASAYQEALESNRTQILSLPNDTIICPGHGPMTTVEEEKQHNPFFAHS